MSCEKERIRQGALIDGSVEVITGQAEAMVSPVEVVVFEDKKKENPEGKIPNHRLIGFASGTLDFDIGGR